MTEEELFEDEYDRPSKGSRKRDAQALQDIGETLTELPLKSLARVPMPDVLAHAVAHFKTLPTREAKRRQLQYIGKIMRKIDNEPIKAAVAALKQDALQQTARFKRLEAMRDKLIETGDDAIGNIVARFPMADRQQLRQLARQARQQRDAQATPVAARQIFRYLRDLEEAPKPEQPAPHPDT